MKKFLFVFSLVLFSLAISSASYAAGFDLEMTGPEYLRYLDANRSSRANQKASDEIEAIIDEGKRNLQWFILINENRGPDAQLALYTPELQQGIPIDAPREYNEETVLRDYKALRAEMPAAMSSIIFSDVELPTTHPMTTDDEYLNWTRRMDRVYQSASRWAIMEPSLMALAARSSGDIRGYYHLNRAENLTETLNSWNTLSQESKDMYFPWLVGQCHNSSKTKAKCTQELNDAIAENTVNAFHAQYLPAAQQKWDSYFTIRGARRDVQWTAADPLLTLVPFLRPESLEVENWLRDNIQDEWRFADWRLELNFVEQDNNTTRVEFEEGATPHVNGLGGSIITMDANAPLQDYGSRWTIRHEYGHTLGLPDCYIEFYDSDREIIINYQIDLDNIMCSRRGHIQERHYNELRRVYYR